MEGAAAEAIRDAEASLAGQQSVAAQIDLQVITAVLNAHTEHGASIAALEQLQRDVENAVASHPDLNTMAGARSFQRFLIGKARDIRTIVDDADLDATSKAALAAALSSLYASSGNREDTALAPEGSDLGLDAIPVPEDDPNPIPAQGIPPQEMALPAAGVAAPAAGGLPPMASPTVPQMQTPSDLSSAIDHLRQRPHSDQADDLPPDPPVETAENAADDSTEVLLPTGETITAPSPELANVITAAVAGTPIAEAFSRQGITIPAPGSAVETPIDPAGLGVGDIGIFTDRHALSLGNGKALLDNAITPIAAIGGPGFLGWRHPPESAPASRPELTTTQ